MTGGVVKSSGARPRVNSNSESGTKGLDAEPDERPVHHRAQVDDTFVGPGPDDAHLTGVILRLNEDGTTPADNPFFAAGAAIGGEVGANIRTPRCPICEA